MRKWKLIITHFFVQSSECLISEYSPTSRSEHYHSSIIIQSSHHQSHIHIFRNPPSFIRIHPIILPSITHSHLPQSSDISASSSSIIRIREIHISRSEHYQSLLRDLSLILSFVKVPSFKLYFIHQHLSLSYIHPSTSRSEH